MAEQIENVVYEFAGFRADAVRRRLLAGDELLPLTSKAFDTLMTLIRHKGATVSKAALMDAVWADTAVEENNLTQQIAALRKAFGERPDEHRFIVTVPGKGYSLVAEVRTRPADPPAETVPVGRGTPVLRNHNRGLMGYAVAIAYVLLVVAVCVLSSFQPHDRHRPSLAVLDFRSGESGDDAIGNGIRDTLRARLGSLRDITVLRDDAEHVDADVVAAGRRMQVDTVITGSVQREHERIRVAVELLDTANGRVVWSKTFDESASNVFALQDSIAGEIARVLNVSISWAATPSGSVAGLMHARATRGIMAI